MHSTSYALHSIASIFVHILHCCKQDEQHPQLPGALYDRSQLITCMPAHLEAPVDQAFVIQLLEDPPHALHEGGIHGAISIFKVNPATHAPDCLLPFLGVPA